MASEPVTARGLAWIQRTLAECWSAETSSLWSAATPSRGQCGVTALVLNDYLGGEILKTKVGDAWHFYNRVAGARLDATAGQFVHVVTYLDLPSSRAEAFTDCMEEQYRALSARFAAALSRTTRRKRNE